MTNTQNIVPVLIGADMNCYAVARAFFEEYGVVSHAFGRWQMGDTMYSRFIEFTQVENIDNKDVLLAVLKDFADKTSDAVKIVLGCTDDYASLLIDCREELCSQYIVPYIMPSQRDLLVNKADFYNLCRKYAIQYPNTFVASTKMEQNALTAEKLGFKYPIIIKPSSSILYWKYPFDGMKKVYTANNELEAQNIINVIFDSGYPDKIILQDMIPGADCEMRVLTAYCDKDARVKMMCLGHVGLEEHTPKALGNHAAIITEYNEPLMQKFKIFLEDIGYVGFANFDIKYDKRDNTYRCFEINLRQGRSNYYVTGAGQNIAKYIVNDRIFNNLSADCVMHNEERYWHSVPNGVVYKYVKDADFIEKAKRLCEEGKESTTFGCQYDTKDIKRFLYTKIHAFRYYKKYKKYCK